MPFLIIAQFSFMIFSCKKENRKTSTHTYTLDSVKVEVNSDVPFSYIIPIDTSYIDSILSLRMDVDHSIEDEFRISANGDTVIYNGDTQVGFSSIASATFVNSKYYKSIFWVSNQYSQNDASILYNYSAERLNNFYMETRNGWEGYEYVLSDTSNNILEYTNNDLTKINCSDTYGTDFLYKDSDGQYMDTVVQKSDIVSFNYLSNENQKDLIGLDLNDLIMNAFFKAYSYYNLQTIDWGLINYAKLEQGALLNSLISYHTNCNHLMSNIEFRKAMYGVNAFIYPATSVHVVYAFDNSKNNRVQTMTVTLPGIGVPSHGYQSFTVKYTFYYKN